MMSTKRVILASGSRLLREMLHRAIDKEDQLEVVREIRRWEYLPTAIEQFHPVWVIIPESYGEPSQIHVDSCMEENPCVKFIFLSPTRNSVRMKWRASFEKEYPALSLAEFIHLLKKDLPCT